MTDTPERVVADEKPADKSMGELWKQTVHNRAFHMQREDNPAPDGEPGQGVCRGVIDYDDPEHWVLVCHYSGWVKPEDNGYAVFMLDRSRFGLEVATAVFGALMGCGDGPSYSTFIEKTSGLN